MTKMLDAPAFHRNKEPVLKVLQDLLTTRKCQILEIASGSGQHGPFYTHVMPNLTWWPSDIDIKALASINAWRKHLGATSVRAPHEVDVTSATWRAGEKYNSWPLEFDCVLSMNMIHIAPYDALTGLLEGASKRLAKNGQLVLYGPFKRKGNHTAVSNQAFDQSLQERNSDWGIRDLEDVEKIAQQNNFSLVETIDMPANNMVVVIKK